MINDIYKQTYKNIEIIVSDDCSTDNTQEVVQLFSNIRYLKTPENLGYARNSRYALDHARGEYLLFVSDDDRLVDEDFIKQSIDRFLSDPRIDAVFGRVGIVTEDETIINRVAFAPLYDARALIDRIVELNFYFMDHFAFSSFIFKKAIFKQIKPFESIHPNACSVDIANIIKYLYCSDRVAFLDRVVYLWRKFNHDSIGGVKHDDLVYQTLHLASAGIDIYNFIEDKSRCLPVCNAYMEHAFTMILAYKEQLNNETHFHRLLPKLGDDPIYIYGRGWVGLALRSFLQAHGKTPQGFIDDMKEGFADTLAFEQFIARQTPATVILASYKHKWLYRLYKKLAPHRHLRVVDLYDD